MKHVPEPIYRDILVLRCQAGDEAAFAELIETYHARLAYYAGRLLGDTTSLEDVLQEIWLAAYRSLPRLKSPRSLPVWLYGIARHKVLAELRRRGRALELLEEPDVLESSGTEPDFSPEDAACIHRGLVRLHPQHREVLVLRFIEEMSYEQIAELIGCPLGTVRSRIHHAKRSLRLSLPDF
ncbi:MAG: sigma-70 family RNA polymerase sigma factor [Planctomycetota bacterium]